MNTPAAMSVFLADEAAQQAFGAALAHRCRPPLLVTLDGDLGAGKTTLVRGFLRALGHRGAVKSPTYTLIEPYRIADVAVYHLDLYRVADPDELEYIGLRDILGERGIILAEWPQRGAGWLPGADLQLRIGFENDGRRVTIEAGSTAGEQVVTRLAGDLQ